MKTKKRFLAVVLAAALLVAGLTGCKDALRGVAQKISGSSGEVQEEDTTRWADATADPLIIQGIANASAKFDTAMVDGSTGEPECFTNVIVMLADISMDGIYYTANFTAGGTGYYANGGKIVPITWTTDADDAPFRFFTADGQPLSLGVGNTYIAVAPEGSPVSYE